jgi:hypothetical protein
MAELKEMSVCEILFPSGKKLQLKPSQCSLKLLRMKPWLKHKCMNGLIISKEMKCLVKTTCILTTLPHSELTKMLKMFARLSLQIIVEPLTKFLK